MDQSALNGMTGANCFVCDEKAIDTCRFCNSGIAYCGDRHMEIHRKKVHMNSLITYIKFKVLILFHIKFNYSGSSLYFSRMNR